MPMAPPVGSPYTTPKQKPKFSAEIVAPVRHTWSAKRDLFSRAKPGSPFTQGRQAPHLTLAIFERLSFGP
jgi:hypothetical protein